MVFVYFQPVSNADFIVPVEIDGTIHQVKCEHLRIQLCTCVVFLGILHV